SEVVEVLDVVAEIPSRLTPTPVLPAMDPFAFERAEEAFHGRVVIAVAAPTHARLGTDHFQSALVFVGGVLAPLVRVVDQPRAWTSGAESFLQGGQRQEPVEALRSVPADDAPREQVHD